MHTNNKSNSFENAPLRSKKQLLEVISCDYDQHNADITLTNILINYSYITGLIWQMDLLLILNLLHLQAVSTVVALLY